MAKIDLKDLAKDVKLDDMFGDLRDALSSRADSLMGEGRGRARRAVGAHGDGALFSAFGIGILVGALIGAAVALLMTPVSGADARRKLGESVDKVRGGSEEPRRWEATGTGNGRAYAPSPTPTSLGATER